MAYQVLARKYRPKNFSELIGQDHVAKALSNAIDNNRLHHAYLFTGTRGVGKTTIARILSKCLNCETGTTATPCGVCGTCQAIDNGQFIDLIEIDAASRTKVEDTRELLENVPYAPTQGRVKVYLIDEVHMLSTHSFNALLKTLEEPPAHVKFLFATTDPQKLPVTIVSRCLQFVLRPLPQNLLVEHLKFVLNQENVAFDDTAIWQLAQSARGSVRDALSLTDQAIAFGGGQIHTDTVSNMLGLIDSTDVFDLIDAIYKDDRQAVAYMIDSMRQKQVDAPLIFDKLTDILHHIALIQILPDIPLDMNDVDRQALLSISERIPADVLQLYYDIVIKSKDSLRLASTPMQALEMTILRLLAFRVLGYDDVIDNQAISVSIQNDTNYSDTPQNPSMDYDVTDSTTANALDNGSPNHNDITEIDDGQRLPADNTYNGDDGDDGDKFYNCFDDQLNDDYAQDIHQDNLPTSDKLDNWQSISQDDALNDNTPNHHLDTIDDDTLSAKNNSSQQSDDNLSDLDFYDNSALSSKNSNNTSIQTDKKDQTAITKSVSNSPQKSISQQNLPCKQDLSPNEVDLVGEWTADKWDFWVYGVVDNLTNDEIALVENALIEGQVQGEATLLVEHINAQTTVSFENLKDKMAQFDCQLSIKEHSIDTNLTPKSLKTARQNALVEHIAYDLSQSPVVQELYQMGLIDDDTPITQTKLHDNLLN